VSLRRREAALEVEVQRRARRVGDSGLSDVRLGDELMGLAGALFALGTCALVASVIPVPTRPSGASCLRCTVACGRGPHRPPRWPEPKRG
jgi:hypothetical protein